MDIWNSALIKALVLCFACGRGRQAQIQYAGEDVPRAVCKSAVFCNFEAVQLNDCQVLVVAHLDTPKEGL